MQQQAVLLISLVSMYTVISQKLYKTPFFKLLYLSVHVIKIPCFVYPNLIENMLLKNFVVYPSVCPNVYPTSFLTEN